MTTNSIYSIKRLQAEASQGSEDQKLVEQLNLDKRQLGKLLLQPAPKLSVETNQRIEALEGEVERSTATCAPVAGLGQARHALGVSRQQVQSTIPNDGALIEYFRHPHYGFAAYRRDPRTDARPKCPYFSGVGVTLKISMRIFHPSPSRI